MGYRRKARECALQVLFQMDVGGSDERRALPAYFHNHPAPDPVRQYAERIVRGTALHGQRIDSLIEVVATKQAVGGGRHRGQRITRSSTTTRPAPPPPDEPNAPRRSPPSARTPAPQSSCVAGHARPFVEHSRKIRGELDSLGECR